MTPEKLVNDADLKRRGYHDGLANHIDPKICPTSAAYRLAWFDARRTGELINIAEGYCAIHKYGKPIK